MAAHLGRWSWAAFRTGRLHQLQPTPGLAEIALWCSPILVDVARKLAMGAQLQTEQRSYNEQVTGVLSHYCDYLRPREFSVRLDVKMKRGAAPYPRNPYKKRPVPKVKGIIRRLIR